MRGREPVKDKPNVLLNLVMGVAMAIIWSAAFVSLLDSPAGIGVGAAFGVVFALLGGVIFK